MIPELKVPFLHEKQVERAANELLHEYAKEFEDAVLLTWLVAALAISVFVAVLEGGV